MNDRNIFTEQEREVCLRVLQQVSEDPSVIDADERMKALIAKIHRTGRKGERRAHQEQRQQADRAVRQETAMVRRDREAQPLAREAASSDGPADAVGMLHRAMRCYICKQPFDQVHFFYHSLCLECAALNYAKRQQRADLSGRTALLTGGRIKIGYQIALRLLRDGARVIVTTRFPGNAVRRFADEEDFPLWRNRLAIQALDLRNLPTVEAFAAYLAETEPHLDILINNAAQTVKRPLAFYRHLLETEQSFEGAALALPSGKGGELTRSLDKGQPVLLEVLTQYPALIGESATAELLACFPPGALDADGQQVDTRPENSWSMRLHEVSTLELLETHLVNAVAPFILCRRLKPLLLRSPFPRRFIVNVSAMEGQFGRTNKTACHPHTNMAKAALNMLTRTSAADFAEDGIYMNSVDTGWITDEKPLERRARHQERDGFYTPLDVIDGMARVYDPIARGVNEPDAPPLCGHFLKDYQPYPW